MPKKKRSTEPIVSPVGDITIYHHDNPSPETIQKRISEVMWEAINDDAFDADCPCCQMFKNEPYEVHYHGTEC